MSLLHHHPITFLVRGTTTRELGLHHGETWEITPWERHSFKYLVHPSPNASSSLSSLDVIHVSHFNQRMDIHSKNKALMCKVFLLSLDTIAIRWFDGLEEGSIGSYEELMRAFGARFVTYSRVSRPLDSLLSMYMREGEALKNYFDRY